MNPLRFLAAALLAATLAVPSGCGRRMGDAADGFGMDLTPPADARQRGAIIFIVDGVNAAIFREMLDAGELPAIREFFLDRGLYVPQAVGNIPSVTLANLPAIATGRFPGHHNITGINWFDRYARIWRNYETLLQKNRLDLDHNAPLIYQACPDAFTASLFFQPHRGATKFYENWMSSGPLYGLARYEAVDMVTVSRFGEMMGLARQRGQFPRIVTAYLLTTDFRAYGYGVSSPQYRKAMHYVDRLIGGVCRDLRAAGLLETIVLAFVSDHSLGDVTTHFPMNAFLRDHLGLPVSDLRIHENVAYPQRRALYANETVVTYGSGDRYWALCLRKPVQAGSDAAGFEPWDIRPEPSDLATWPLPAGGTIDLPRTLADRKEIDAIAYATGPNRCRVRTADGEVEFHQADGRGGEITYCLTHGTDPLGWIDHVPAELLAGGAASPDAWLATTHATQYPDLPAQIVAYFRSTRAGDIACFAAPGYDFRTVHNGGHGGLRPYDDMFTPLLLAGPGVPRTTGHLVRTVDLTPTILDLVGCPPLPDLDGQSLTTVPWWTTPD
ncbi:MAG: hypothetical protein GVY16_03685 [Planctomycetes bacterium]|nr:hypothetical protein [Planctomycetota bacterium]